MIRAFIFLGERVASAGAETLRRRVSYGGRKGLRAKRRLEERLTWSEVCARASERPERPCVILVAAKATWALDAAIERGTSPAPITFVTKENWDRA